MKLQIALTTVFVSAVALAAEDPSPLLTKGARINGQIVTAEEVRAATPAAQRELPDAQKTAMTSLVDRVLILQEFERRKLSIPQEFIDQQIANIVAKEFGGDRSALEERLRKDGSNMDALRRIERDKLIVATMRSQAAKAAVGQEAKDRAINDWLAALRLKASIDIQ